MRFWFCLVVRQLGLAAAILVFAPVHASAQTTLRDALRSLFLVDFVQQQFPGTPDTSATVGKVLGAQISTFPLSSSSSGFTWRFDGDLGVLARSTRTFGPTMAERPTTMGQRKIAVGFTHQYLKYDGLGGRNLSDSPLNVYKVDLRGSTSFASTLDLKLSSMTDLFFFSAGATERLDVAVAIPFITVALDGATSFTGAQGGGRPPAASRSAKGVGDVALRAKYQLGRYKGNDYGMAVDLRVPSGNADNFLGTGKASIKVSGLFSQTRERLSPYANLAVTAGGVSNEVSFVGGADIFVTSKMSIATDIVGRRLVDVADYSESTIPYGPNPAFSITLPTEAAQGLNLALWTIGAKVNVARTMLLTGTLITSLTKGGLRARFAPIIGVDYSF